MLEQQIINGLTLGVIYALIAVGYTMVYGVIQLINFAHGEIYMLGAFLCTFYITTMGAPFYVAIVMAMVTCSALGVVIEIVAYRPLRKAHRLAALITAIGMSIFLQNLALIIWGSRPRPFTQEAVPAYLKETALTFGDVSLSWLHIFIFAVTISMMIGLYLIINKTKTARPCAPWPRTGSAPNSWAST